MSSKPVFEKKRKSFLFYIVLLIVVGYAGVQLISMNIEITQKRTEYDTLVTQRETLQAENEQLERYTQSDANRGEYIEQVARDKLDYAYPNETIYNIIPGA